MRNALTAAGWNGSHFRWLVGVWRTQKHGVAAAVIPSRLWFGSRGSVSVCRRCKQPTATRSNCYFCRSLSSGHHTRSQTRRVLNYTADQRGGVYSSVFPSLNMAVKRREQALQDYKRLQSKVEKYEEKEKTGPIMVKLHQAREELKPVREDFEGKNKQLLDEMPKFYNSRIDYFQPSFEALIRAQVSITKKLKLKYSVSVTAERAIEICQVQGGFSSELVFLPAPRAARQTDPLSALHVAINHQSVSRGTPDSRAGGRAGAGRVKKAFSRHSLAHTTIAEDQGHLLPTDPRALSLCAVAQDEFWFSCMSGSGEHPLFGKKTITVGNLGGFIESEFPTQRVAYFTEMHKIFTELTDQIDQGGLTDEQRKQENEAKLNELRALSIVADD
ncbi:hypothetical protein H4Q32_006890 [Labeo rohita]|uniref:BAR domain-containing protein n=1 Tax=Labeo rohita TaxID=84645 RepID=A0ABQ8MF99_LABRO|nr:hypothetical protein H4Q32_006890 [Labeo rohita]